ncbi:MAG TPA: AAA family ATPase [Sulfurospirillum arcachonense]|nr:AAA family ATPase [Sulfurospirillum arcachonense]HIP45200.1 AAA family ATPase [Sulfurospirillum arcachonense]
MTYKELKMVKKQTLNPNYRLDNFVVDKTNISAYIAIQDFLKVERVNYSLILHGKPAVGKTHLVHALGNSFQELGYSVLYVSCEEFMNDFGYNLRNHTSDRFREKYRTNDLLILDDIEYMNDKEQTQKELFYTIKALKNLNKKVIFVCNGSLKKEIDFYEKLTSRTVLLKVKLKIQKPKTKLKIVKQKMKSMRLMLDKKTLMFIAKNSKNSYIIEGMLTTLVVYNAMYKNKITYKKARKLLAKL